MQRPVNPPSLLSSSHASHVPVHAFSQHTPSTQNFDAHSEPSAHPHPLACRVTHTFALLQYELSRHSSLVAHLLAQALPLHLNSPQLLLLFGLH
jgi:hypothetical protein